MSEIDRVPLDPDDFTDADARSFGVWLLRQPLATQFLTKSIALEDNRVYLPEDVLGERFGRWGAMLVAEAEHPGTIEINANMESRIGTLVTLARTALQAAPYLWSEAVRAQLRALKIPRHVLSPRLLPAPKLWFTFETGVNLDNGVTLDFMLVVDHVDGFEVIVGGESREDGQAPGLDVQGRPFLNGQNYKYGQVYPDDFPANPTDPNRIGVGGHISSLLAMLAFLASPFIPKIERRMGRAARREAVRKHTPVDPEQTVTFIILRRPESRPHPSAETESVVDWHYRWIVSGHLRAQWYPSEQAHRLIWIAPYLKGPEDAPLLEHAFKVAR